MTALFQVHADNRVFACKQKNVLRTMQQFFEKDNGVTVTVRSGDSVEISLPENATTGYRWAIDHYDQDSIAFVSTDPHYPLGPPGSGGTIVFVFRAIRTGSGIIALKQWRSWEGDSSVIHRYHLQLNVQP
jgi:inhibitor of cysteine peptidase